MEKEKIARINELAKKKRENGLTEEELAEHKGLQTQYIQEFRASVQDTLEHTFIKHPDGTLEKLSKKDDQKKSN